MLTDFQARAWAFALHLATSGEAAAMTVDPYSTPDDVDDCFRSATKWNNSGLYASALRFDSHWFSDVTYEAIVETPDAHDTDLNGWDRRLHGDGTHEAIPPLYGFDTGETLDWAGWSAMCLSSPTDGPRPQRLRVSSPKRPGPARPTDTRVQTYSGVLAGLLLVLRDLDDREWPTDTLSADVVALTITGLARSFGVARRPSWFDTDAVARGVIAYAAALRDAKRQEPYTSTWADGTTYTSKRTVHADTQLAPGTDPARTIDLFRAVGNTPAADRALAAGHIRDTGDIESARAWTALAAMA